MTIGKLLKRIMNKPKNSILTKKEVSLLLPQKEPFVLVNALFSCNKSAAKTGFTIPKDHSLVENEFLVEAGLLENMAQSIALKSGFLAQESKQSIPKIGYLAAIKNAEIYQLPKAGQKIITHLEVTHTLGAIKRYLATIKDKQNNLIAKAEITTTLAQE